MYKDIKVIPCSSVCKNRVTALNSITALNNLKEHLNRVHFRSIDANDDSAGKCHWCEHHRVQLLDPSDPDNSGREFYCSCCAFMFQGVECALDLTHFTCDCFADDKLFQEAFKPYSAKNSKQMKKRKSILERIFGKE